MDFKEKYEMALAGIQEILSSCSDSITMSRLRLMLQGFFPELKESESEDERIRKWLISQLKIKSDGTNSDLDLMIEKAIVWLENQKEFVSANFEDVWETADCEKLTAPLEKYEMETIKKLCHAWYDKGIELERKKGVEAQDELAPNPYSGVSFNYNGNVWGMCARDNGVDILFNKKLIQHISAEIQRDKIEPKFKEGDKVLADGKVYTIKRVNEATYIVDENGREVQEHFSRTKDWKLYGQNSWKPSLEEMDTLYGLAYITHVIDDKKDVVLTRLYQDLKREFFGGASYENMFPSSHIDDEKQDGQKPVYTPSFNVDDFIANEYCTGKVVELTNDAYLLDTGQGIPFSCDSTHLWSIKDAKPGDILHAIGFHSDCVFIFNGLGNWKFDEPDGDRAVATGYCCLSASADKMEFGIQGPDYIEVDTVKPATKIQCDLLFAKMREAGYEWDAEKKELKKVEQEYHCNGVREPRESTGVLKQLINEQNSNCSEEALQYLRENHSPSKVSDFQAAMNIAVANAYDKGKADAINTMKTEWGEEDEKCYNSIIEHLKYSITNGHPETYRGGRLTDWLKSIKDKYISEQ